MSLRHAVCWALSFGAAFAMWCAPAHAALRLCNQTSYVIYAATGIEAASDIITHGWTRVAPGECEIAVPGPLSAPAYFLYARSSQAHSGPPRAWGGATDLCAKETNFSLRAPLGTHQCPTDDAFPMAFAAVDTKGQKGWTTTFTEGAIIASLGAASSYGINRLLNDIGYRFKQPKEREAALKAFRARMRLPEDASADDLIDALETEAMKAASPAGYSICNDTQEGLWAALGTREAAGWVSRGWWTIAAGACARAITVPLKAERVYLLVEKKKKQPLVAGNAKFCVTDIEFDIAGRERCAERGLREAGFAETLTKGRAGYTAHVSGDGLIAPVPVSR